MHALTQDGIEKAKDISIAEQIALTNKRIEQEQKDAKDVSLLQRLAYKKCIDKGWTRDWSNGGCYLHLEVSEFIEALRGKGNVEEEAADILFIFLSMLEERKISFETIVSTTFKKRNLRKE